MEIGEQCDEAGLRGGAGMGEVARRKQRLPPGYARARELAGQCVEDRTAAPPVPQRALQAEVGDGEDDKVWILAAKRFRLDFRAAGLDEDVRVGRERLEPTPIVGVAQIERGRALAQVRGDEIEARAVDDRAFTSIGSAVARLDADHVGAELGELPPDGRHRARHAVEHANARQRRCRACELRHPFLVHHSFSCREGILSGRLIVHPHSGHL
jgi:hypothetical protein